VDAIITTVVCGDPFPHNALPTLGYPTHISHAVVEDGTNVQPCFEDMLKKNENLCQSNAVSKPEKNIGSRPKRCSTNPSVF
jgi:hypothetical protein